MGNENITKYIKEARSKGMQDDVIRAELLKAGWKKEDVEAGFTMGSSSPPNVASSNQSDIALQSIDRSKIKETATEKKSDKILLYNTRSYFWIGVLLTMFPVFYMTWKNTRYYNEALKEKLRKFIGIYLVIYVFATLLSGPVMTALDNIIFSIIIYFIIILPYFYYTNVNEYPIYKKLIDNKIARARASVAPVIIGLIILFLFAIFMMGGGNQDFKKGLQRGMQKACSDRGGQWLTEPKPHCELTQ